MTRRPLAALVLACLLPPSIASAALVPQFRAAWGGLGSGNGQLHYPFGITTHGGGDIFVADSYNNRIQRFNAAGTYVGQWGSPGTGTGQFNMPFGLACDGNYVYVADANNHRIQKFTLSGTYVTWWGGPGSTPGLFNSPFGVAVDGGGNIYVADTGNNRVQKFTSWGVASGMWGGPGAGNGQFSSPSGVAVDAAGDVYVTDWGNSRVQKFSSSGTYITQWGGNGATPGKFNGCTGITVDAAGNVFVVDTYNRRIQKFTTTGAYLAEFGGQGSGDGQFSNPYGVAVDQVGDVCVADSYNNRVQVFSSQSTGASRFAAAWGSYGSGPGQFSGPLGLSVGPTGTVCVTDYDTQRVQFFAPNGTLIDLWSAGTHVFVPMDVATDASGNVYIVEYNSVQKFGPAANWLGYWGATGSLDGQFQSASGIAVDGAGYVYVADEVLCRIQKFTSAGAYVSQWGTGGNGPGQLNRPKGVAVDGRGYVYVCDTGNNRIQKFTTAGAYVTLWGVSGTGSGQFQDPLGIAADPAGNVFVTDRFNDRVQEFTGAGAYLAQWGSPGTASGCFDQPWAIATDPVGGVYVTDSRNHRVQKLFHPPVIAWVADVPNDQGQQARITFAPSSADDIDSCVPVTQYEIYRYSTFAPAAPTAAARGASDPDAATLAGWEQVATVGAHGESQYNVVVPTLGNATASANGLSWFMVRAATADPYGYFDSAFDCGYSVDNLSPPAPTPFTAAYAASATHLHWGISTATDFARFQLYRGTSAGFTADAASRIATTTDTSFADLGSAGRWYKLTAVDFNGNESPVASVGPDNTLAVSGPGAPAELRLAGAVPNPTREGGAVHFVLPCEARVELSLFDVAGRRVRALVAQTLPAGDHETRWERRDDAGGELHPGLYFLRLETLGRSLTRRVVVLE